MTRTLLACATLVAVLVVAAAVAVDRSPSGGVISSARAAALAEAPHTPETAPSAEPPGAPVPTTAPATESDARPRAPRVPTPEQVVPTVATPEGWQAVAGAGEPVGDAGRLLTYSVESEPGLRIDEAAWVRTVTETLEDTERGWTASGRRRLQRVDTDADLRVVLASPATVDAHCARAGLRTNGIFSCWVGDRAMLNAERWRLGSEAVPDLRAYRQYLVNHEVGHGLGLGHVGCPARGALAPVMMQQTKSTGGCIPNGWPSR